MKDLYTREGFVETRMNDKVVFVYWQKMFNSNIVRESCEAQLKAVIEEGAEVILVDVTETVGKPTEELQQWFEKELFPAYNKHGLKAIITVKPKNPLTASGVRKWQEAGKPFGFEMFETSSLIMARKKAREIAS